MTEPGNPEDLALTEQLSVRVSPILKRRLEQAAAVVSGERAMKVDPLTLAREIIAFGVETIRQRGACVDESSSL